jgi:hypothetical protein
VIFDVVHSVPFYEGEHTYLGIGIAVGIITLLQLTGVLSSTLSQATAEDRPQY